MKNELGLQELFMFAPTTNKIMINGRPSVNIRNKPTTLTAIAQKYNYGRDTATSTIRMNQKPKDDIVGFNQDYLTPMNDEKQFKFSPLYAKIDGNMEIPVEEDIVVDAKRVEDITIKLSQQVDAPQKQAAPFHFDKETNMIHTVDKGQYIQVDINELPVALQ